MTKMAAAASKAPNSIFQFDCELDTNFLENLVVRVSARPDSSLSDITDDLRLESYFLQEALASVSVARARLEACGRVFNRPPNYHAHMLKTVAHLARIEKTAAAERATKEAAAEARRQRLLRTGAKRVQQETLQKRAVQRKSDQAAIDAGQVDAVIGGANGAKSAGKLAGAKSVAGKPQFKSGKTAHAKTSKTTKASSRPHQSSKRSFKDSKYGFGGRDQKTAKRNSRASVDSGKFSVEKNRAGKFEFGGHKNTKNNRGGKGGMKKNGFKRH